MKKVLESFPKQCEEAVGLGKDIKIFHVNDIIVTGMGGSAFAGDILNALIGKEIPVQVNRDYDLPTGANKNTLVFAISYSGNTEETLEAVRDARRKGARVITISSGGELARTDHMRVKVPKNLPPRCCMGYLTLPMLTILQNNEIIRKRDLTIQFEKDIHEKAKKIAKILKDKTPIFYSSDELRCIAYGWKTRINENSKIHAFSHTFPELDHNELVGYTKKIGEFHTIIFKDSDDRDRIKKRIDITAKLIRDMGGECTVIELTGKSKLSRIFNILYLADWVSYYLAEQYEVKAEPVAIIEILKDELAKDNF